MTIYGRAAQNIGLIDAIDRCRGLFLQSPAVALLYTPNWCGFAQVELAQDRAELKTSPREEKYFMLDEVFEARVFNEQAELRWLKDWPNQGRAALISVADISNYLDDNAGKFDQPEVIEQTYLLWGEGVAAKNNDLHTRWSRLAMARIGMLDVPYPLDGAGSVVSQQGERIQLIAHEYLHEIDDFGNVGVVEERLVKLARA